MRNSSNRGTSRTQSRSQRTTNNNSRSQRNSSTSTDSGYSTVAKNIYRDGSSYRARVSVNGIRQSRNFGTKREAIQWRNEMIADRA